MGAGTYIATMRATADVATDTSRESLQSR